MLARNVNPIEKLECSSLIISKTVHGVASHTRLLSRDARKRVAKFSTPPALMGP